MLIISGCSPWQETGCFPSTAHSKSHVVHCVLMCSNEVLQLALFNLWGIELDVPPIFTEMEMKSLWMCAHLSTVLIGSLSCLLIVSMLLMIFILICRKLSYSFNSASWKKYNVLWNSHIEQSAIKSDLIQEFDVTWFGSWHFDHVMIKMIITTIKLMPVHSVVQNIM